MPDYNNIYGQNQGIMNQLLRQKDNVENMIQQYSQMSTQPPIQNIINQGSNLDFEARILKENEDLHNIAITRRTLFVDEANKKISIKELDGTISKEYEIIIPLDEKDKKIIELENKLKEMEEKINVKYAEPIGTNVEQHQSYANANVNVKSSTKANDKSIPKSIK